MTRPSERRVTLGGALFFAAALAACGNSQPSTQGPAANTGSGGAAGEGVGGSAAPPAGSGPGGSASAVGGGLGGLAGAASIGAAGFFATGGAGGVQITAASCGPRTFDPIYTLSVVGDATKPYEGPAIVERSASNGTSYELVLAFAPTTAGAGALPEHATISGLDPLPAIPQGAKVWFSRSADPKLGSDGPVRPWWFAVRDKQNGSFLIATGIDAPAGTFAPFSFDNKQAICTSFLDTPCAQGPATYSSIDVHGDTTVTIDDGQWAAVAAGGVSYDVGITSMDLTSSFVCPSYAGPSMGLGLGVRAKDLASVVAGLTVSAPIACGRGDADSKIVTGTFDVGDIIGDVRYDGKAVYSKRVSDPVLDCFRFESTVSDGQGGLGTIDFCTSRGSFAEPTVGQEFWATQTSTVTELRGPNRGAPLLVLLTVFGPFDATTQTTLQSALGIPVATKQACSYADVPGGFRLWEVDFGAGASTAGLVAGGHATFQIGGRSYGAWMDQSDSSRLRVWIVAQ